MGRSEPRHSRRIRVIGEDASSTRTVEEAVATYEADSVSSVATLTPGRVDVVILVSPALAVDVSTAVQHVRRLHGDVPIVLVASDVPETRADAVVPVDADAIERTVVDVLERERIDRPRRRLRRLSTFASDLAGLDDVERVCARLVDSDEYDSAWLVRRDGSSLVPMAAAGVPISALRAVDTDADEPWARAVQSGESVVVTDDEGSTLAIPFADQCLVCTTPTEVTDEELAALERAVSSFVSLDDGFRPRYALLGEAVAHEVNNQLDLAMVHLDLVDEKGEHLEYVEAALNRIDDVVAEVNALVAPELSIDEVSLEDTSEDVWNGVSTNAASLETNAGIVEADERLMRLLLTNLFRNAVQHGGDDVSVEVGPLDAGGFYVEDDGEGFAEESPEQLFEWGWSEDGGTGIGLALVSLAADRHGWDVETLSDDGARFEFRT